VIDFLEIDHIRKYPITMLPYGLQKRVELGRALAMQPKVLLLDEPVAGMNREETADMARFILDVQEQFGTTILLVEHDMHMVMDICSLHRRAELRPADRPARRQGGLGRSGGHRSLSGQRRRPDGTVHPVYPQRADGGAIYALIAVGIVSVFKATKVVNFAHGYLIMFGAYFYFTFAVLVPGAWAPGLAAKLGAGWMLAMKGICRCSRRWARCSTGCPTCRASSLGLIGAVICNALLGL
jgi:hypothetical protein